MARHLRTVLFAGFAFVSVLLFASPLQSAATLAQETAATPAQQTAAAPAQETAAAPALSDAEVERFLRDAKVLKTRGAGKGVTNSIRATLSDGTLTHEAHIQTVDESKREFVTAKGTEFNFRDSWTFNIAGYKLDRLLGMNLVPVSVSRRWKSTPAAYTWWVDDVLMDEEDRLKKKISPPMPRSWNEQMQLVRLFDQLIYNTDRNLGNLLILKDWRISAIDHTRAFRTLKALKTPENVTRCDRGVFDRLKQLDKETLKRELTPYLDEWQIDALLARRDLIVERIEKAGPAAVFDRQ